MQIRTWFIQYLDQDREWNAHSHAFSEKRAYEICDNGNYDDNVSISSIGFMEIENIVKSVSEKDTIDDLIINYPELSKYTFKIYNLEYTRGTPFIIPYSPLTNIRNAKIRSLEE